VSLPVGFDSLILPICTNAHIDLLILFNKENILGLYCDSMVWYYASYVVFWKIRKTKEKFRSECLLRLGVLCVFVLFCVCFCVFFVFVYGPFCQCALNIDMSTLFTTFFLWTSLQFIFQYLQHGVHLQKQLHQSVFDISMSLKIMYTTSDPFVHPLDCFQQESSYMPAIPYLLWVLRHILY